MENKNQGDCRGRAFRSGSVSLTDGCIGEIHTYEFAIQPEAGISPSGSPMLKMR